MNPVQLSENLMSLICSDDFDPMMLLTLAYQLYHIKESETHNKGIKKKLKPPQSLCFKNSIELYPLPHNPTYLQFGYGVVESRLKSSIDEGDEITSINISHTLNEDKSLVKIVGISSTKIEMFNQE
jgi:hypothetical protein